MAESAVRERNRVSRLMAAETRHEAAVSLRLGLMSGSPQAMVRLWSRDLRQQGGSPS